MSKSPFRLLLLLAASCALGLSVRADVLLNGGLEAPPDGNANLPDGNTSIPDWTVLAYSNPSNSGSGFIGLYNTGSYGVASQAGQYYVDLTSTNDVPTGLDDANGNDTFGGLYQTFNTTIGDQYTVDYYVGTSSGYAESTAGVDAFITTSAPSSFSSIVGTTANDSAAAPFPPTNQSQWTLESFDFTATSTSTTLTLIGYEEGSGLQYVGLDSVSVDDDGPTSPPGNGVPDNSSSAMLLVVASVALLALRPKFGLQRLS